MAVHRPEHLEKGREAMMTDRLNRVSGLRVMTMTNRRERDLRAGMMCSRQENDPRVEMTRNRERDLRAEMILKQERDQGAGMMKLHDLARGQEAGMMKNLNRAENLIILISGLTRTMRNKRKMRTTSENVSIRTHLRQDLNLRFRPIDCANSPSPRDL